MSDKATDGRDPASTALAALVDLELEAAALVHTLQANLPQGLPQAERDRALTLAGDLRALLERLSSEAERQVKQMQADQGLAPDD